MISGDGRVAIVGTKRMLFLSFANRQEAERYFRDKVFREPGFRWQMKSFEVPKGFYDAVRGSSIPEYMASEHPMHGKVPVRVHETIGGYPVDGQYGLPRPWIERLQQEIKQGTGRILFDQPSDRLK